MPAIAWLTRFIRSIALNRTDELRTSSWSSSAAQEMRTPSEWAAPVLAEERQLLSAPFVLTSPGSTSYTENAPPVTVDPAVSVFDPDGSLISSATVQITPGTFQLGDQLHFTDMLGISGSYNAANGTLTLTGTTSETNYALALRSIQYSSLSDNPSPLLKTVSFTATDEDGETSVPATKDIIITPVNDPPAVNVPGAQVTNEGTPVVFSPGNVNPISVSDVDSPTLSVDLSVTNGALTLGSTPGGLTISGNGTNHIVMSGTQADLNTALNGLSFLLNDNQLVVLTVSVSDGVAPPAVGMVNITVNNVAPTLTLNPVTMINENGTATLSGTISDPGTQDTFSLTVDWGDGSAPQVYNFAAGTTSFSVTHPYLDDNPTGSPSDNYTITATLADDDSGSNVKMTSVTVNNVAPTLTLNPVTMINENGTATLSGTISDPGTQDTFSLTVDWGDGSAPQVYNFAAGTTSFSVTHPYLDDNPTGSPSDNYTITATLADDDSGSNVKMTSVIVNNLAPVINTLLINNVNEGSSATLTGTYSDVGTQDTHVLDIDWDGDNVYDQTVVVSAGTFSIMHLYADNAPTFNVNVRLRDDDTGLVTGSVAITVSNVAPTIVISGAPTVNEGSIYTLNLGAITDPGQDTVTSYIIHWGDGTDSGVINSSPVNSVHNHTYENGGDPGTVRPITVELIDEDGTFANNSSVTVTNVQPAYSVVVVTDIDGQFNTTVNITIVDPGADPIYLEVYWSDFGTTDTLAFREQISPYPFPNATFPTSPRVYAQFTHHYTVAPNANDPLAPITITFYIRDGDGPRVPLSVQIELTAGLPAIGGVYLTPDPETISLPTIQTSAIQPVTLTTPSQPTQALERHVTHIETKNTDDRLLVLRVVLPDGTESDSIELQEHVLTNLPALLKQLPDGHYRIYLIQQMNRRLVVDVYVRQGKAIDPNEAATGTQDRPPVRHAEEAPNVEQQKEADPAKPQAQNNPATADQQALITAADILPLAGEVVVPVTADATAGDLTLEPTLSPLAYETVRTLLASDTAAAQQETHAPNSSAVFVGTAAATVGGAALAGTWSRSARQWRAAQREHANKAQAGAKVSNRIARLLHRTH